MRRQLTELFGNGIDALVGSENQSLESPNIIYVNVGNFYKIAEVWRNERWDL